MLFLHFGFYEYYCHEHFMCKVLGEHKFSILLAIYLVELLDLTVCAQSLQSCPTLCDPMDCSLLGSSVHGISQAIVLEWIAISCVSSIFCVIRTVMSCHKLYIHTCLVILEWVAIPFSRGSSQPRDRTWVSCIGRWILYH